MLFSTEETGAWLAELFHVVSAPGRLYAVVDPLLSDPAWNDACWDMMHTYPLLLDRKAVRQQMIYPHLALIETSVMAAFLGQGYGNANMLLFTSTDSHEELALALSQALYVQTDNGPAWFRWYDPRVFRSFFPLATEMQLAALYGVGVSCFYAEHPLHADAPFVQFPRLPEFPAPTPEPLFLSAEQVRMLRQERLERMAERLAARLAREEGCLKPAEVHARYQWARALCLQLAGLGYDDEEDLFLLLRPLAQAAYIPPLRGSVLAALSAKEPFAVTLRELERLCGGNAV